MDRSHEAAILNGAALAVTLFLLFVVIIGLDPGPIGPYHEADTRMRFLFVVWLSNTAVGFLLAAVGMACLVRETWLLSYAYASGHVMCVLVWSSLIALFAILVGAPYPYTV